MNAAESKMNKDAQPGNSFEGSADNAANQGTDTTSFSYTSPMKVGVEGGGEGISVSEAI